MKRRVVKFLRFGKSDVQTALEAMPFGIDGHPIKDMVAVYLPTTESGKTAIVGYFNKNQLADVGELRMYSTDSQGETQAFVWLQKDGLLQLNGKDHFAVRFAPLDAALSKQAVDINTELVKIAGVLNSLAPGSYTPTPISIDISGAKNDKVKMN